MAANLSGLSASVTRILYLTGFPKELKTKDIQSAFAEFENQNGGFKIKWKDDTSLLIVFQDPTVGEHTVTSWSFSDETKFHQFDPDYNSCILTDLFCSPSS